MYLCLLETPPPALLLGSGAIHLLTPSKWAHLDTAAECWILMEWCSRSWVHKLFTYWYCCRVSVSVSMLGTIRSWAVENPIRISTRHPLGIHRLTPDLLQTWLGISDSVYTFTWSGDIINKIQFLQIFTFTHDGYNDRYKLQPSFKRKDSL